MNKTFGHEGLLHLGWDYASVTTYILSMRIELYMNLRKVYKIGLLYVTHLLVIGWKWKHGNHLNSIQPFKNKHLKKKN